MQPSFENPLDLSSMVLVASPNLSDPSFARSLVFIAEHNREGAVGMIMNRPLSLTLGQLSEDAEDSPGLEEVPVFLGGPVRKSQVLMAVFGLAKDTGKLTCRLDIPPADLPGYLNQPDCWIRAYLGYAGWGKGQLEAELKEHAWSIQPPEEWLLDTHIAEGLWPMYHSSDQRWRSLYPYLPRDPGLN